MKTAKIGFVCYVGNVEATPMKTVDEMLAESQRNPIIKMEICVTDELTGILVDVVHYKDGSVSKIPSVGNWALNNDSRALLRIIKHE